MSELRVGIVGAGHMGATHARCWEWLDGACVVAVADVEQEKAETLATKYGATAFASLDALLAAGQLDVVSICTPTPLHREHAERAFAAGLHVLCEKPLALTVSDCDAMIAAAAAAGKCLTAGQVVRFFPEFANAKRLVESGAVGTPAVVRTRRGGGFPSWSAWFADEAQTGGICFDLAVHDIDWLLWTFGPIERVYAKGLTGRGLEKLDYALLTMRHTSGTISHTEVTWADPKGAGAAFEIAGDAGLLTHDARKAQSLAFRTESRTSTAAPLRQTDDPYYNQIKAFAAGVRGEQALAVTGEDGRAAVRVAVAAVESLKSGRAIAL